MAGRAESMKNLIWFVLCFIGCSEAATELTSWQKSMRDGSVEAVEVAKAVEEKTDAAVVILKENTAALARIETKLEASLVDSESVRKEDDQQSAPNPPAKANTALAPLKVATPGDFSKVASDGTRLKWDVEGDWNPTILETSAHLREHGINTDGMTHQEMSDIHASIHEGKPVAMKSETVRYVSRGTNCPNGQCPTSSTRYVRRSRR
jgi:hypothetical protein